MARSHAEAVLDDTRLDALLVHCLELRRASAPPERLGRLSEAEWDALVRLASWHAVAPLLQRRLREMIPAPAIPASADAWLRRCHQGGAMESMRRLADLAGVLRALAAEEVRDVIVLKGAHLVIAVYGDPGLRMMKDVDILVRRADLERVERALLRMGYRQRTRDSVEAEGADHHHLPPFSKPGATTVEVHSTITPPALPVSIELEGLWRRAKPLTIGGTPALGLSLEDLLLHLVLHAAQHRFRVRQRHLCDIALTVSRFRDQIDWRGFVLTVNESGAGGLVFCALRVAQEVLGADVPAAALEHIEREAADEAIVPVVCDYFLAASLDLPVAYREAREVPGFATKAGRILRSVVPSLRRLRAMYGLEAHSRVVYLYYPVRIVDLVRRRGAVLLEMARRSDRFRRTLERDELATRIDRWLDGMHRRLPS